MADNSIQLDSGGSYLFVGNSFTFGRVDPVMSYNTGNVRDLTAPAQGGTFTNTTGSNPYEPHPWGGVPGLFEAFASQAGLELDVAISARNAATLQGQYLNSNPAGWDLRGNVASQAWDVVVLQDNSTQPLPSGSGSITFAAGSSTATLTIDPTADTKVETDETIGLQVTASSAYRTSSGVVTGTILNDDPTGPTVDPTRPTVTLVASPNAVAEDGTPNLVYTFTRTGPTTSALTVNFAAARDGGTAPSVTEYTSSFQSLGSSTTGSLSFTSGTGSIVIKAGASSATFTLDPIPDSTVENDESVRLTLSTNSNYNVGTQGAVSATILNDDFAPGTDLSLANISLSIASSAVYEDGSGNLVYQFTRSGSNAAPLTVNFSVSGTATLAGNDFTVTGANSFSTAGAADPNLQSFQTYAVKLAQYATTGAADGAVPANTHANAATDVYLYETWARPNMVTGALVANTDDTTGAVTTTTTTAPEFYLNLEAMTADLKAAYQGLAAANSIFAGVAPVGEAFLAAVQNGTAMRNPYAPEAGKVDLWWDDNLHASKYGSYLSGLTLFGKLTGLDPRSLGAAEHVASDLGITQAVAAALQNVAAATLGFTLDAHWTSPGQVTELQGGVTGLLATEGSFGFSDSDVADTHTIAVTALTPGSVGTFSAAIHTDTTGDGTGGSVDWLFTVDNADVGFLAPGESRVEHFLVTISDANGGSVQRDVAVTLNGTYNDAPGAAMTTDPYAATEQTALNLKGTGMSVSDVDSGGASETVTLSVGEGTLHVDAGTSGAGVSGDNTSSVTITGTLAQINALLNTDGTSVVSYIDNTDTPSASTTLTLHVNDGGATGTDTSIINITAVNDAPVATITPTTYSATEQTALDLKNNGLSVSDVDGNAGSQTVTLSVIEGTLTVTAGGSGAIVTNSGTSSVTITGTAAQINTLLNTDGTSTVSYTDGGDNPSTSTTLTLLIHDNGNTGGGDLSSSDTATINITAVNDAPVATITPASYSVTENAALSLKNNGLAVSDIDGNSGAETVTLAVSDGILNVTTGGSGAAVSGSGTGSVTITGTIAQINALLNSDGTSTVSYVENDNNPGTTASLSLTIHDNGNTGGGDLSSVDTAILNITQVNNAPVGTITPASYAATENVGLDLKNNGLAISDVDGNAGSETVTLSVGEGVLNVTAGGSGATVNNSGTNSVTITGSAAQINALLNTDGTSAVGYVDNNDVPAPSTTLTLLVHDNGNTGGGDLSSSDTATINITAVNDAPVFANLGGASHPNFVENGSPVALDNNVTVSDPELNAAGNYGGATLTLARNGGANADDTFAGTGSLDLTDSNGLGENVSLDGGATFIGTSTQPGDGTFSITFNASATAANIASVMQQIVYANTSDNPEASAQIDWSFDDGNTGVQGGGAGVATGSVIVDITQVDDAPVLINVAATAAYVPGTAGAVLSSTLGIFDLDATAPSPLQGLASATIKIDSGFFAGDELFVNLATSGGHFVTPDGDTTNIAVQSNVLGMLVLSGNDTVGNYQSVLDAVSYHSTAADPSNGGANPSRNISWQVNDGALNSQTPNPDPDNLVSETVLHFDLAPQVDLDASGAGTGFTTAFTENGAPIAIVDTDLSIADSDDANLDTATIVLTNAKPTDALSIAGALPGGINSSIDTSAPGQITLHLSGSASLADYQAALGQVRFVNSSDTPDTTDRDITVSVTNGADSNVAHATIHVIAVDDAPVAANASAGGSEDTPISGIVSATDMDNTPSQLSYSLVGANGGAAHGAVVFHVDGSYTYNPVHDFNGSDSFSFKANDGQLDSNVATVSLAVSAVNDAPVAANASASGNEDTTINGTLSATDVDNTSTQLSYKLVGTNGGAAHGSVVVHADGTFTYTPASNFNGSDSFSFKANDGALDSNVATESLTINAVNDAPVNTVSGPLNAQNGLDAAIIGLAVSDLDAVSLTTSLHVDHGMLSVGAVGGATVNGSGTGTVTLSGSVAQINAALGAPNNVLYQSAFDFVGTDHLTMTSNDGGGTGSGGPQTDTDVVDINAGHSMGAFLAFSILGSSDFHLH